MISYSLWWLQRLRPCSWEVFPQEKLELNWVTFFLAYVSCFHVLEPFARWNEGFSCTSLLIHLILGTGTCSGSTRHCCGLFCTWLCLLYMLWSSLAGFTASTPFFLNPACATVPQLCASVGACCVFAYSCGISLVVLQYYKMFVCCHMLFLVCLYLSLGQTGINYILLSMVLICQCIRPLLWLQLVPKVVQQKNPPISLSRLITCVALKRYLLNAALT